MVEKAAHYTELGQAGQTIVSRTELSTGIVEMTVRAPMVAHSAHAGQFVRVLASNDGELIPLTLADWDAKAGTIDLVIQGMGTSTQLMNRWRWATHSPASPVRSDGRATCKAAERTRRWCSCAGGVGLPPVYPDRAGALRIGNHVDPDRRLPRPSEPPVLDREGRARRQAAGASSATSST